MANEIISYLEMCGRERVSLQRGMNYHIGADHSVILMSVLPNSPYSDRLEEDGTILIYEGHDVPRSAVALDPKHFDQPEIHLRGGLTENGKFHKAAQEFKKQMRSAERVKVYEKLRQGIWSYNGVFHLIDSYIVYDGKRNVFNFRLVAVEEDEYISMPDELQVRRRRIIPTSVKLEVWKRDAGICVICGAKDELHFDHILPYSKGGTSSRPENIQLLCARHNLEKGANIQ